MMAQDLLWLQEHGLGYHFEAWAWEYRLTITWPGVGRFVITDNLERSLRRICGLVTLRRLQSGSSTPDPELR